MDLGLIAGVAAAGLGSPFLVEMARGYWTKRSGDAQDGLKLIQQMNDQISNLYSIVNSLRAEADECHKNNAELKAEFAIFKAEHTDCAVKS